MDVRAADVEIAPGGPVQPQADDRVDGDRRDRDGDHQRSADWFGLPDAGKGFPSDHERDDDERRGIDERGEDAHAVVPERHAVMGHQISFEPCRIPRLVCPWVLYYNADLFDRAGLPYPSADWKWADLLAATRRLTRRSEGQYGYLALQQFRIRIQVVAVRAHATSPQSYRAADAR